MDVDNHEIVFTWKLIETTLSAFVRQLLETTRSAFVRQLLQYVLPSNCDVPSLRLCERLNVTL